MKYPIEWTSGPIRFSLSEDKYLSVDFPDTKSAPPHQTKNLSIGFTRDVIDELIRRID